MTSFFESLEKENEPSGNETEPNRKHRQMARLWSAAVPEQRPEAPDPESAWQSLRQRMEQSVEEPGTLSTTKPMFANFFALRPLLIGVCMMLVLAVSWWWLSRAPFWRTGPGQNLKVAFEDGSHATLNAVSELSLERGFNRDHRSVRLSGEAFFSVEKGTHPFRIETGLASVTVLGTQFNVFARGSRVEVAVAEGRVSVAAELGGRLTELVLEKGEFVVCTEAGLPDAPSKIPFEGYPGWRYGLLAVDRTPLAEICGEIERRFNVSIELADPTLAGLEVTGMFEGREAETLVSSICVLIERKYTRSNETFVIE